MTQIKFINVNLPPTSLRLYHGSTNLGPISKFRVPSDHRVPGVWATPSKQYAAMYGRKNFKSGGTGKAVGRKKAHVIPLDAKPKKILNLKDAKVRREWFKKHPHANPELVAKEGYDLMINTMGEYVAVKPNVYYSAITGELMF